MNDLEKLISQMTEDGKRGAALGYVLGYHQGATGVSEQIEPGSPEHRLLTDLGLLDKDQREW